MSKKKHKKSDEKSKLATILLITAILDLIKEIIDIVENLIE